MKRSPIPSFLLELPLVVSSQQARHLRAHLEAARCLSNALLGQARKRLLQKRRDPAWQAAQRLLHTCKKERQAAFSALRAQYGFTEYALHAYAKTARCAWIADHIDSTMAQTLATRAYQAVNRMCLGHAEKVRLKSKGRGIESVEGKRNDTGMRFVLQDRKAGNQGWLVWGNDHLPARIDWHDTVVHHGPGQKIKYARLVRRTASSPRAKAADCEGNRYYVQLILEGTSYQKIKDVSGTDTIRLDIGPSTIAIVARSEGVTFKSLGEELAPDMRKRRRLQRHMERQRHVNNPEHYDAQGRVKKTGYTSPAMAQ